MRQLLPVCHEDVDIFEAFTWHPAREFGIRLGMVMSVDGAATDEQGWTSQLGGSADKHVLRVLRALCDGILVGAGSVRTGRYVAHRPAGEYLDRRMALGKARPAPLVVVTESLRIEWTSRVFTEAMTPTMLLTCASALCGAEAVPSDFAGDVIVAGEDRIDMRAGLAALARRHGMRHILCEGGPRLASGLLASGLVDELCLSLAPVLVPGNTRRLVENLPVRRRLALRALFEENSEIFIRYAVDD